VVSIDYRLTPQHSMPAQMEDVARAVQFVRSKAREWNLDPNHIAAFGCTAEQYEQDPAVRQRIRDASPAFLATRDDPPAFVLAAWSEDLAVLRDPPVPAVINDPHSAWHSVLLAEALVKAGGTAVSRIGPEHTAEKGLDSQSGASALRDSRSGPARHGVPGPGR